MSIAGKLMTAEEFEALPDDGVRRELIEGQIHVMSPAFTHHGLIGARLLRYVGVYGEEHGYGETVNAQSGYIVAKNPDTVLDPDGAFVRTERINRVISNAEFREDVPDLVIEVISPSQTRKAQIEKGRRWIKAGCELVWVVDSDTNQIIVLEGDATSVLSEGQELTAPQLLPGFALKLEKLFRIPK